MLLFCTISSLRCMDKKNIQRLYPLGPVLHSGNTKTDEQAQLLIHDFLEKDRQTLVHATPPSYDQLYIGKEESERELQKLQTLFDEKEKELATLPKKLHGKIIRLARERELENIKSNATIGGFAFAFYFVNMWLQIAGDPRMAINGGNNESVLPCFDNILGWFGSLLYSGTQCSCRKPDYYEN